MNKVPNKARTKTTRKARPHTKHLQATYRLTCDQAEGTVILRFERVDGKHPTGIQWEIPIKPSYECATIQILDDKTFKFVCWTDGVIYT